MWLEWLAKSTRRGPIPAPPPSPKFSCSSFKDVQTILKEGSESKSESGSAPEYQSSTVFHRNRILRAWSHNTTSSKAPPKTDPHPIILYHTSLRIVRKTYEDCRTVRLILRGFRVPIDERDVSMDGEYLDELHRITKSKDLTLPLVFIGGQCIGGAEEVKGLQESGELSQLIGALRFEERTMSCNVCGGLRFVVCQECNGSHKIYVEKYGFRSCTACNTNGLVRCDYCYPMHQRRISM